MDKEDRRAADRVFFDGGCPVCRREIAWYADRRGGDALRWIDVTDDANTPLFPAGYSTDRLLKRFTVVRNDGQVVTGAPAFVAIWRAVHALSWLGQLMDRRPIVWVLERMYRTFLVLRRQWRRPA